MKLFSFRNYMVVALLSLASLVNAQDFMLQGFYYDYPAQFGIQRWGQNYLLKLPDLKEAGFTYIWLPPLSRASGDQNSTGYDVKDYYDLGEYGGGATRFGTRRDVDKLIAAMKDSGITAVADLIFNHRAGGEMENNGAVQGWITNYNATKHTAGDQPYPSDRFRCYILLGDTTHNTSGTYYVKFRSASLSSDYYGKPYTVRMWTHKVPLALDSIHDSYEFEPNDGGSCGDSSNYYPLGTRKYAHIDGAGGCGIDEFRLVLDTSMFNTAGDTLYISMENTGAQGLGDFSDHYVYGIYSGVTSSDITSQVVYQTGTDFTHLPSGKGAMTKANFKPDGNPTQLSGDWDEMLFFYDIDQNVASTKKTITDFTEWMFDSVKIGGIRLDAVKNYPPFMVSNILDTLVSHGHNPDMVVGEYYDYNPASLKGWVDAVYSNMAASNRDSVHVRTFDFALRGGLKAACDQFGYDVRGIYGAGMVNGGGASGFNVVTFVNNHDFRDSSQIVVHNPELPYAYILTNNQIGLPCVFHKDYFDTNFMRGRIKALMKAHKRYIFGATGIDYLNSTSSSYTNSFVKGYATTTLCYQLHNTHQVIVAINFAGDSLDMYQKINLGTTVAVGDTFTDIFAQGAPVLTTITNNQEIHVKIPPRSFTIYVQGNHTDSLITFGDTLIQPVGIVEPIANDGKAIHVFPNPFSSDLNIQLDMVLNGSVITDVYDLTGKKVYTHSFSNLQGNTLQFDPCISTAGMYILNVTANNEQHYYKLFKH